MRLILFLMLIVAGMLLISCGMQDGVQAGSESSQPAAGSRQPVLVELFTSEGCSSCPPADRNLIFLEKQQPVSQAEIITLAFHVDYWDRLGWKDRFSSAEFSSRQEGYMKAFGLGSSYTPQMVVDGTEEFVGGDSGKATKEIMAVAGSAKASIEAKVAANRVSVEIANAPKHNEATVYAAIAEDGISSRVERGENAGNTLEHVSVVRELKNLGTLSPDVSKLELSSDFQVGADWKRENLKIVVFVQENESRKVIGVGRVKVFQ